MDAVASPIPPDLVRTDTPPLAWPAPSSPRETKPTEPVSQPDAASATEAAVALEREPEHWTGRLLWPAGDVTRDALRLGAGLALSAAYGTALGARSGGLALLKSGAMTPMAFVLASAFGLPALYVAFAMANAPVAPRRLFGAAARAGATLGLVLAGLAPLAALYVVSSDARSAAALAGAAGLAAGSLAAFRRFWVELTSELRSCGERVKLVGVGSLLAFALFAAAVAVRVWGHLPLFMREVP